MKMSLPECWWMSMNPPPPMLPAAEWTTVRAKPTATAASTALPPFFRMSTPASVARWCTVTTMACGARTGSSSWSMSAVCVASSGAASCAGFGVCAARDAARARRDTARARRGLIFLCCGAIAIGAIVWQGQVSRHGFAEPGTRRYNRALMGSWHNSTPQDRRQYR
jgi:hypothetical protein